MIGSWKWLRAVRKSAGKLFVGEAAERTNREGRNDLAGRRIFREGGQSNRKAGRRQWLYFSSSRHAPRNGSGHLFISRLHCHQDGKLCPPVIDARTSGIFVFASSRASFRTLARSEEVSTSERPGAEVRCLMTLGSSGRRVNVGAGGRSRKLTLGSAPGFLSFGNRASGWRRSANG